jgi:hypothetical protein
VFGQNHLCVKMRKQGFHFQSDVSRFCKSEEFQVPCQPSGQSSHPVQTPICPLFHPSGRCVIPSGRYTVQHHPSRRRAPSVRTLHCIEKFLFQLAPSGRFSNTSGRLSVLKRFSDSFQVPRKGRSINRLDDVVSRPDACLHKARIAVQIDCPNV